MSDANHLIITVHGIRTYGNWQRELGDLLEAAEPGVTVLRYQYGFFSSLAFLVPPLRWLVARRFRNFWVQAIRAAPEGTRIDLVAHSFGTYLAAAALPYLPEGRRIHTVIFAGSVLRPSFPWYKYLQSRSVGRLVNECGWDDSVLVLCQSTALLLGMAGRIGFHGMVSDRFVNRYYRFGHGGYFDPRRPLMRDEWVPLLTTDAPATHHDERPPLTALGGAKLFLLSNMQFIKMAGAFLLLMLAILIPLDWYRKADYQRKSERLNHIALLTNAQEIPGRDPGHVRDLLQIDARASGNERAIDHLIGTEAPGDAPDDRKAEEDDEPQWWERLPGLADTTREAYRARRYHHLANRQLVAVKDDEAGSKARAQSLYESALNSYRRISDYDPAHGSYALCLIDYGSLLHKRGEYQEAIDQYQKVREEVFPPDAKGERPGCPPSLLVDSLVLENEALRMLRDWDKALARLEEAIRIAKEVGDKDLLSFAYLSRAWFRMERLEVNQADEDFEAAEEACKELVNDGKSYFKSRLFNIRHGIAMADRLEGSPDAAYDQYQQIVRELDGIMVNDLKFTPKQRRDLRVRLVNSLERRADVYFFASPRPAPSAADGAVTRAAYRSEPRAGAEAGSPARVVDDFQEAIERAGNDDLDIKTRLLYKKVIARFMAELQLGPIRPLGPPGRHLQPIDLEFDEANRTFDLLTAGQRTDLTIYREIATACMGMRRSEPGRPGPTRAGAAGPEEGFPRQAVDKLRALTLEYARGCQKLNRERVEMLLLSLEILLRPGVEPEPGKYSAADATRMIAVLGETTKVGSHPELMAYFTRFQEIAARPGRAPAGESAVARAPAARRSIPTGRRVPAVPPGTLLVYLRLGPRLSLTLTSGRDEPLPAEPPAIDGPARTASTVSE